MSISHRTTSIISWENYTTNGKTTKNYPASTSRLTKGLSYLITAHHHKESTSMIKINKCTQSGF